MLVIITKTVRLLILLSVMLFLLAGPGMPQEITDKEFDLMEAAEKGESRKILDLLNDSINPDVKNWDGMAPLHYASQNGQLYAVKVLVLNGASVNVKDDENRTPLHLAVHFNSLEIAEFLVQHQADINARDNYGLSPLFYASAYGDYFMTDMFLFYSKGSAVTDHNGRTPFLAAVWGGHLEVARLLLSYFAEITETDKKGNNAIHLAILNNDKEMIDSLVSWGCDFDAVTNDGYSGIDIAIQENNSAIIEQLIGYGANLNNTIKKGFNSLDLAILYMQDPAVRALMEEAGAERNKKITFSQPAVSTGISINPQDAFSSLQFELWEPKYGIGFDLGVSQRLGRLRVLTPAEGNIRYQFRETRTGFYAGAMKQWMLLRFDRNQHLGMNIGFDAALYIGDYKASETNPRNIWVFQPAAGLFWHSGPWQLGFLALIQDMKTYQHQALRFGMNVRYRFNELK